jgi:hypothetical protein
MDVAWKGWRHWDVKFRTYLSLEKERESPSLSGECSKRGKCSEAAESELEAQVLQSDESWRSKLS